MISQQDPGVKSLKLGEADTDPVAASTVASAIDDQQATGSDQILFIDSRVSNYRDLLKGLAAGTQVYILNPDEGGLAQIAAILASRHDVADVSIIAHGNAGEVELGSTIVTQATLAASATDLHTIGAAIAPGGDLLVYGCDVGEGSAGQSFVNALAATTGANVAAASHIVGDVAAGEGWNLDVTSTASSITAPMVLSTEAIDAYAHPLIINDPPAGLPITFTTFTGNTGNFSLSGGTVSGVKSPTPSVTSAGYLQLTSATANQASLAVYNQAFPSSTGISVQFTYYSGGGNGADGISFFLLNADAVGSAGASSVVAGGYGGGLGYSDDGQAGITDGFLGLGFDTYGNYSAVDRGQTGTGQKANEVAIRGSGTGTTGYALLTNAVYASGIDGTRTVKINLIKTDATHESVSVFLSADGGATYQEVITNYAVAQTLPSNFYLGFAASTGGSTDTHQIENLSVTVPVALTVSAPVITYPNSTDASNLTLLPGDHFSYSYQLINGGPNGSSEITLQDALPSTVTASSVSWTLQDDLHPAGSLETGTGNINLSNINLASGDSATVTVSGTISSTAATGNVSHTITATPGTGFSFVTPSAGVVGLALGSPNPYLSGANTTGSTIDTAPIRLFSNAQIADAHSNPTFTDTITLTNSAGTVTDANGLLSGTGLTETATKGIYTLTATGVSVFNSDLQGLVFTPVAKQVASGQTVVTNIAQSISNGSSGTTPAKSSQAMTTTDTCFLAGSHILTDRGEIMVEALQAGDQVATLEDGRIVCREIIWVGCRHVSAAAARDASPIRIRQGAFAGNVPHRDLLVTPEHCIFVDGRLIPARMLVNHRSIIEDRTIGGYSFHHVELASHAILLAEGLATESYLDTGNRSCFANATVVALRPDFETQGSPKSWNHDACAPLAVDRETVQPIWERLDRRATSLGFQLVRVPPALSDDPQLRLRLCDGRELQPCWSQANRQFFQIPPGARPIRLLSRRARPAEVIGSFVDDRRELGIGVARLVLWNGLDDSTIEAAALALPGWHALEQGIRWTDGDAELDLPAAGRHDTFLDVHVVSVLRYPASSAACISPATSMERASLRA